MAADEKREHWVNYLALTTVILAVCATLSTFKGGGNSTRSVLSQTQASDQWAFYQSKSIKSYLYELQADQLKLDLAARGASLPPEVAQQFRAKIESYEGKLKKYEGEKATIEKEARRIEGVRDDAALHGRQFGLAVIFLQIAILLSSIAALLKLKPVWFVGLVAGLVGIVYFANGFFLFLP